MKLPDPGMTVESRCHLARVHASGAWHCCHGDLMGSVVLPAEVKTDETRGRV